MKCVIRNDRVHTASLEYNLAETCNLRCAQCSAASPYFKEPEFPRLDEFEHSLHHLSKTLYADQIKFLGGEPLLNKEICRFIDVAKSSGMFGKIRVCTNGLLLFKAPDEFWRSVDVVEISHYTTIPRPLTADDFARFEETCGRFDVRLEVHPKPQFNVQFCDTPIPDPMLVQTIYSECCEVHVWSCHTLYKGRYYRCSRSRTLDRYLSEIGVEHDDFREADGLQVDETLSLERLRSFIESPKPLQACRFCLGTSGRAEPQRQLTTAEIKLKRAGGARDPFSRDMLGS